MSVNLPGDFKPIRMQRLDPLDKGHNDERGGEGRKKKVSYQGRSWREEEEDLPLQPTLPRELPENKKGRSVYADAELLENAEKFLSQLITIEEKVAQLFFYSTEAFYEVETQKYVEMLIQQYQIGGLLFTKGEFRRQLYLIERYQLLSKTHLLIGNDFLHGLSFYFQGEVPYELLETMDERKSSDLGKAVVYQNKKLGVHFQFDAEKKSKLKPNLSRSFRNGIREAHGVVAREKTSIEMRHKPIKVVENPLLNLFSKSDKVQEAYGLRTFHFVDFTDFEGDLAEKILDQFVNNGDAFLLKTGIVEAIEILSDAVKQGKIKESDLDRKVIKILLLKKL